MNPQLDKYFTDNHYSVHSSENDENSYYNPLEEIHENALYTYKKFIKNDEEGVPCYEESLIHVDKATYFGNDPRFYYILYVSKSGPFFGTGHGEYKLVLPHNEELTVEHIESIRKLMKIPY